MSSTVDEYHELINAEVYVEIDKLRDIAKHGIPDEVRGEVWKYLLGVQHPDKSKEMSSAQNRSNEYLEIDKENSEVAKRVKGEVSRYQPAIEKFREKTTISTFEHVICAYVNSHRGTEYSPNLVYLCSPFVFSLKTEEEIYYCFESLMEALESHFQKETQNVRIAKFITLFRTLLPDLHNYFEEEDIDLSTLGHEWLSRLLTKELNLQSVLRLWDTYFSVPEGFDLHVYVCIAILKYFKDQLDDLEHSEILGFLRSLPNMDMDEIITEAQNLREEVQSQGVL